MLKKLIGKFIGRPSAAPASSRNREDSKGPDAGTRKRRPKPASKSGRPEKPGDSGTRKSPGPGRSTKRNSSGDDSDTGEKRRRRKPRKRTGGDTRSNGRAGAQTKSQSRRPRSDPSGRSNRERRKNPPERDADRDDEIRPVEPRVAAELPEVSPDHEFSLMGLAPFVVASVQEMGFEQPTPIQSDAIPVVLANRDVIGSAQTGTGKTAAFGLPIIQKLESHGKMRCLVLEPTRELALQLEEALVSFSKFTDLRISVIYGGVGYGRQKSELAAGVDIVVATPGRLLDHMEQGTVHLDTVDILVLDEVDRMLDMGFLPDVKRIVSKVPKERQTLFFSATIPPAIAQLTTWVVRDPEIIEISRRAPAETVSHAFYPVVQNQKFDLLIALLERTHYESVLIFCRTKIGADMISRRLDNLGHPVAVMHSNRSQSERTEALTGFKSGKYEVLVATDVASRGLDIAGISHVVNYDTPLHPEDYVHRIGRTGRALNEGDAFTLLTEDEIKYSKSIERFIGKTVDRKKLEDFDYAYSAVFAQEEAPPKNVFKSRLYRGSR